MIHTGDKLICTSGNEFYEEGELYTVGEFVNDKYFELSTGCENEHWYASIDDSGIYVSFDSMTNRYRNARFNTVKDNTTDWLEAYHLLCNV